LSLLLLLTLLPAEQGLLEAYCKEETHHTPAAKQNSHLNIMLHITNKLVVPTNYTEEEDKQSCFISKSQEKRIVYL
jgi:hypothetical protein